MPPPPSTSRSSYLPASTCPTPSAGAAWRRRDRIVSVSSLQRQADPAHATGGGVTVARLAERPQPHHEALALRQPADGAAVVGERALDLVRFGARGFDGGEELWWLDVRGG